MEFLYAPPPGFNSSVDLLNVLNLDSAQTIAYEACISAFDKRTNIPPSRTELDASFCADQISSICNALSFVYEGSLRSKLAPKTLEEGLATHTDLETNIINVVVRVYHRYLLTFIFHSIHATACTIDCLLSESSNSNYLKNNLRTIRLMIWMQRTF